MMCFKDITYCELSLHDKHDKHDSTVDACANENCDRFFNISLHESAVKWWGNENYPLCIANLMNSELCNGYIPQLPKNL